MNRRAIGLIALTLFAGAAAADRFSPAGAPAAAFVSPIEPGGVLACPFLGAGNGRAWVHVANIGRTASKVTITTVRDGAGPLSRTITVGPGRTATHAVDPGIRQSSGAIVSYAGGSLIASRSAVFAAGDARGAVAAPCAAAGARTLVAASGSTLKADTVLYLLNPSSADAVAGVGFLYGGDESQPEALRSIVVAARSIRRVRVGDFAFDQRNVASVVRVRTGVLAADAVVSSERGITLTTAVQPGASLAGVGAADAGGGIVDVVAAGDAETDSVIDASLLTSEGQSAFASLPQALEPFVPQSLGMGTAKEAALGARIQVDDGAPVVAGLRWIVQLPSGRGDVAGITLGPAARRLAAVTGDPAGPGQTRLLLANPGTTTARVRVTLLTGQGSQQPPELQDLTLQPGAATKVSIGSGKGTIGVIVESTTGVAAVLGSTVVPRDVWAFAVEALAAPSLRRVGVAVDPRLGIPA